MPQNHTHLSKLQVKQHLNLDDALAIRYKPLSAMQGLTAGATSEPELMCKPCAACQRQAIRQRKGVRVPPDSAQGDPATWVVLPAAMRQAWAVDHTPRHD